MYKTVKAYFICYYESKICFETTVFTVNSLYVGWNLDATFILYVPVFC